MGWVPETLEQLSERMHEEDRRHLARIKRMDTQNTYTRVERQRGGYVWLQWHSMVGDEYTCLLATEQTDMYASMDTLRQTEERYKQMVQYAGHLWLIHDEQGKIIQGNQAILEALGYTAQEFESMHVYDVEMTVQQQSLTGIWSRMPLNHTVTVNGRHRRKDGTTYPVEMKLRKFTQGSRMLVSAVGRDVSKEELVTSHMGALNAQLKHARDRAMREKALQNEFISAIAQSLSTPLSAIMGYAQMVREDVSHEPLLVHHLNQILVSADQMGTLFDDLFELSSLQANTVEFELMRVRAKDLVQECLDVFGPQAKHKGLEFRVEVDDALEVEVDVPKIRQALSCMLSNALTYTDQGHVHLKIEQANPYQVSFVVEDTGRGFTKDQQARVFDPFHPTHQAKAQDRGTGLSLGICKLIFARMGGDLTLESQPQEGSRFEGVLPLNLRDAISVPPVEGATLLVISQDHALLETNRRILAQMNAHVLDAPDHYSALERARTIVPDLILIHLDDDAQEASQLMRKLLADPNTAHIPVVVRGVERPQEALRQSGALIQIPQNVPEQLIIHRLQQCLATTTGHIVVASPMASTREIFERSLSPLNWSKQGVASHEALASELAKTQGACIALVDMDLFEGEPAVLTKIIQAHPDVHCVILSNQDDTEAPDVPEPHVVMTKGTYTLGQLIRTVSRVMFESSMTLTG